MWLPVGHDSKLQYRFATQEAVYAFGQFISFAPLLRLTPVFEIPPAEDKIPESTEIRSEKSWTHG